MLLAPVSIGELVDKITVLQIKSEHIEDPAKKANVLRELELLSEVFLNKVSQSDELSRLVSELKLVNKDIWDLSDVIHECEKNNSVTEKDFNAYRIIHTKNDKRFALKKEINKLADSKITEEKSYKGH